MADPALLLDFGTFRACYGSHEGEPHYRVECDYTMDGSVGMPDFGVWRGLMLPEPGTGLLLAAGIVGLYAYALYQNVRRRDRARRPDDDV